MVIELILSQVYQAFNHQDVIGVELGNVIKSVLINKDNSRPLGPRLYSKVSQDESSSSGFFVPDGMKFNKSNATQSLLFFRSCEIQFDCIDEPISVSQPGPCGRFIVFNINRLNYKNLFAQLLFIFNRERLSGLTGNTEGNGSFKNKTLKEEKVFKNGINKREFTTFLPNRTFRTYEEMYPNFDLLTKEIGRYHVRDY